MEENRAETLSPELTAAIVSAAIAAYAADMAREGAYSDAVLLSNGLVVRSIRRHRQQR